MANVQCKDHGIVAAETICCECKELYPILKNEAHWFEEIMAIMHGDGGHYLDLHGVEKAAKDALAKYYTLKTKVEESASCAQEIGPEHQPTAVA